MENPSPAIHSIIFVSFLLMFLLLLLVNEGKRRGEIKNSLLISFSKILTRQ